MNERDTFEENDITPAPIFAGRATELNLLQQYVLDRPAPIALCFSGWHGTGKTALLRYAEGNLGEDVVAVYMALGDAASSSEDGLLRALAEMTTAQMEAMSFNTTRLPQLPVAAVRQWLKDEYLPIAMQIIRRHRRIIWLFDDAEMLVEAIVRDALPMNFFSYLHELLETYANLGIVLTIDAAQEINADAFSPIVTPNHLIRLNNLEFDASAELLRCYHAGLPNSMAQTIHQAAGGYPLLLVRFGERLAQQGDINSAAIRDIAQQVYDESDIDFRAMWQQLSRNERLVLTALSHLLYNNPKRALDAREVERWLIETDYPLDVPAIHAAIRSLEYREIVHGGQNALRLPTGLLQRWLLEHGRLDDMTYPGKLPDRRRRIFMLLVIVLLALAIALVVASVSIQTGQSNHTPAPTITLNDG